METTKTNPTGRQAARKEGLMASSIIIRTTRTIRFRGGRSIARGSILTATIAEGGFVVAHPSGIEGAGAFVPAGFAVEFVA